MKTSLPAHPANTTCAICGATLRCGAIGDGKRPDATCWCSAEEALPAHAQHPGQGCRCQHCLREAIARARAASAPE
jgi:ribosomal protein L34E